MHDLLDADLYDVLGVSPDADQAEIARAYRRLARETHPDTLPDDPEAAERFGRIARAYEVLSDPDEREAYDHRRAAPSPGPTAGPRRPDGAWPGHDAGFRWSSGDDDLFADLFGAGRRTGLRGADVVGRVQVELTDIVDDHPVDLAMPDGSDRRVTIPAGIVDGDSLRIRGAGLPGHDGGPAGDLIVEVSVAERGRFRRDGDDVVVDAPIGFVTAALGGAVRVPTPRGRTVKVKVPAGSSDGRRLRIPGAGIAGARGAGDLHARLHIVVPEGLDDETAATLEALRDRLDP